MTISIDAPWSALFQGVGLLLVVVGAIWAASKAGRRDPAVPEAARDDASYDGDDGHLG